MSYEKTFRDAFDSYVQIDEHTLQVGKVNTSKYDLSEDHGAYFFTNREDETDFYEIATWDTYQQYLTNLFNERRILDMSINTNAQIWNDIFTDGGCEPHVLHQAMIRNFHLFWDGVESRGGDKDSREVTHSYLQELLDYSGLDLLLEADEQGPVIMGVTIMALLEVYDTKTCLEEYGEADLLGAYNCGWDELNVPGDDVAKDDLPVVFIRGELNPAFS